MMATLNFGARDWRPCLPKLLDAPVWRCLLLVAAVAGAGTLTSRAEEPSPAASSTEAKAAARFQDTYKEARERWQAGGTNLDLAWQFSRAAFNWAELATNDSQRAEIAEQGIAAGRKAIELQPNLAATHYYLALNLGQLARTKLLGALKLVEEMEERLKKSIELNPKFEYGGAHRSLGLLYRDAPGWPTSIGSRGKARQHLLKAVELGPEYPGNRLALMESHLKWGEKKTAQTQVGAVEEFLKSARSQFAGDRWALDWLDWNQRWEKVKAKAAVVAARSAEDEEK